MLGTEDEEPDWPPETDYLNDLQSYVQADIIDLYGTYTLIEWGYGICDTLERQQPGPYVSQLMKIEDPTEKIMKYSIIEYAGKHLCPPHAQAASELATELESHFSEDGS